MCQPVTVQDLISNATFNRRGLTGRFLYAFPPSKGGNRTGKALEPNAEAVDAYNELIRFLLSIRKGEPQVIPFSTDAHNLFLESIFAEKEALLRELDPDDPFRGWAARMHGHAARLAGILHVCEYGKDADRVPIWTNTLEKAMTLTRYFKAHAEYAFNLSGASMLESERDAHYIWKRIQESGQAQFAKRALNRLCQRFKQAEEMDAGLNELATRGYIRILKNSAGRGHPSVTIEVNPEALKEN